MRCILAVDNGGSKCEAALVRDDGVVLGWGICRVPGLNGRTKDATREAKRRAMASVEVPIAQLHVACLGDDVPEGLFAPGEASEVRVHVIGEHDGALCLTGCDHGVVVVAGTGAFVNVQAPDGRALHLDGLGPLLGDFGSGYQIGYEALRAAMKSDWHPRHRTALKEAVLAAFNKSDLSEMVSWSLANPDRCVIAALANDVDRLANAGDAIARRILEEAAAGLAETLRDAITSLGLAEETLPMVGTGSIAKRSSIYWTHFCRLAADIAPRLTPVLEPLPSAAGMALAILRRLPGVDQETARENLFVSAGELLNKMETQSQ